MDQTISAIVGKIQERKAATALHRTFSRHRRCVHIPIADLAGLVGRALLRLIGEQEFWLQNQRDLEFSIVGAINTRKVTWNDRGLSPRSAIVTSNKIANALDFAYYKKLRYLGKRQRVRYLYEATVGEATPMLQTLDDLRCTGDTIRREAGYRLERDQIQVESLVPEELQRIPDVDVYLQRLAGLDAGWSDRVLQSAARGNGLTYLARFDGTTASVGVAEVSQESPFVRLRASENAVQYYTDRHLPLSLTIQGIGAGADATARGVLGDIIHTAVDLAA